MNVRQLGRGAAAQCSAAKVSPPVLHARRCAACVLCDLEYQSWAKHAAQVAHVARHTVCKTFVVPERHEAMLKQLWSNIRLDFQMVDEASQRKEARRRSRLSSTLTHLHQEKVLQHAIPHFSVNDVVATAEVKAGSEHGSPSSEAEVRITVPPTELRASEGFQNLFVVGEAFAMLETLDRVSRLMPSSSGLEADYVTRFILSSRHLSLFFDILDFSSLLVPPSSTSATGGASTTALNGRTEVPTADGVTTAGVVTLLPPALRQEEKAAIVLAVLGELYLFSRRDRHHSVASKAAADDMVLNVLGTHVLENVIAEMVHHTLQKIVEEGTPVWNEYNTLLTSRLFEGNVSEPYTLQAHPHPRSAVDGAAAEADLALLRDLESDPVADALPDNRKTSIRWMDLSRSLTLDIPTATLPNKTATIAPLQPRLVTKRR